MQFQTAQGPIDVNVRTFGELREQLSAKIKEKQGFALATLNLDHLVQMNANPAFYQAYLKQDIVVADGNPIVWMSKLASQKLDLLPGSDLIAPICEWVRDFDESIALVGSTQETLDQAATDLKRNFPGLKVVCKIAPAFGFDPDGTEAETVLDTLRSTDARICFIALGAPKQERLAARGRELAPQTGFVSIGAGLDFIAGSQERAPKWVRVLALEWLWRLLSNPSRMAKRYAKCFAILPGHVLRSLTSQKNKG